MATGTVPVLGMAPHAQMVCTETLSRRPPLPDPTPSKPTPPHRGASQLRQERSQYPHWALASRPWHLPGLGLLPVSREQLHNPAATRFVHGADLRELLDCGRCAVRHSQEIPTRSTERRRAGGRGMNGMSASRTRSMQKEAQERATAGRASTLQTGPAVADGRRDGAEGHIARRRTGSNAADDKATTRQLRRRPGDLMQPPRKSGARGEPPAPHLLSSDQKPTSQEGPKRNSTPSPPRLPPALNNKTHRQPQSGKPRQSMAADTGAGPTVAPVSGARPPPRRRREGMRTSQWTRQTQTPTRGLVGSEP